MLFKINSHTDLKVTSYSENTLQILLKATRFPKDDHYLHLLFFVFILTTEVIDEWKETVSNFPSKNPNNCNKEA